MLIDVSQMKTLLSMWFMKQYISVIAVISSSSSNFIQKSWWISSLCWHTAGQGKKTSFPLQQQLVRPSVELYNASLSPCLISCLIYVVLCRFMHVLLGFLGFSSQKKNKKTTTTPFWMTGAPQQQTTRGGPAKVISIREWSRAISRSLSRWLF